MLYQVANNYDSESWSNHLLAELKLWHPNWCKIFSQVFCFNFYHLLNKLIPFIPTTVDISEHHHFQWHSLKKFIDLNEIA